MKYTLQIQEDGKKLANIFTKNYSPLKTPRSTMECSQKVLKLSLLLSVIFCITVYVFLI